MADKTTLEQMLEHLVNDDAAKAEELFHEYVVSKSREIYEDLIEEEVKDDEEVDEASKKDEEDEEDKVDEASKDDDAEDEKVDEASETDEEVDEEFEDVAIEADDEDQMDAMGGDKTDDLETDITGDSEEGDKEPEELFQDLDSIVDELQSKFDEIKGDDGEEMDMDAEKEEEMFAPESSADPEGDAELATMREYVEKVTASMGDNGANTKSTVAGANNMGGTSSNLVAGGEADSKGTTGGLAANSSKEDNMGNINVPGGKASKSMKAQPKGHGAEKKSAGETADNKKSTIGSK